MLEVHGFSEKIEVYENNGTNYTLKFTITTNENFIAEASVVEDGTRLVFGGQSKQISAYDFINDTYQLAEQFNTEI